MALHLEIAEGPNVGARFRARPGATIGRRDAEIVLDDVKVSGKHAVIEVRDDTYYVVDAGSANGIRLGGSRVPEIRLVEGVRFQIGQVILVVVDVDVEPSKDIPGSWAPSVQKLIQRARTKAEDVKRLLLPFDPPLVFSFIQGRQTGTQWTVGYGPREVGGASVDLRIEEPGAPAICFELIPAGRGTAAFRTRHKEAVRLNGHETESAPIGDGDIIDIHHTRIQISCEDLAARR